MTCGYSTRAVRPGFGMLRVYAPGPGEEDEMKVLVTGGTGTLGRSLLARPAAGHSLRTFSRRQGRLPAGVEWVRADLGTGAGVDEAVSGVDAIVHAASNPRDSARIDVQGTQLLLDAAARAGVGHVVYVSIVGIDRVPFPYYRHKLETEGVVRESPVPWTILRITQFHDFIDGMFRGTFFRWPVGLVPKRWKSQPIHVDDAADALWACVDAGPSRRVDDLGGPEVLAFGAMARAWKAARGSRKPVLPLPIPGSLAAAMREGWSTAPERAHPGVTWGEWVAHRYGGGQSGVARPGRPG